MNPLLVGPLFKIVEDVLDRIVPDRNGREQAKIELKKALIEKQSEYIAASKESDAGQVEVNKIEAAAPDLFRGGWRPFIGWVCGSAVAYQFLVRPLLTWLSPALGITDGPPALDMADLMFLLAGMLGLGTLRTVEKKAGVG